MFRAILSLALVALAVAQTASPTPGAYGTALTIPSYTVFTTTQAAIQTVQYILSATQLTNPISQIRVSINVTTTATGGSTATAAVGFFPSNNTGAVASTTQTCATGFFAAAGTVCYNQFDVCTISGPTYQPAGQAATSRGFVVTLQGTTLPAVTGSSTYTFGVLVEFAAAPATQTPLTTSGAEVYVPQSASSSFGVPIETITTLTQADTYSGPATVTFTITNYTANVNTVASLYYGYNVLPGGEGGCNNGTCTPAAPANGVTNATCTIAIPINATGTVYFGVVTGAAKAGTKTADTDPVSFSIKIATTPVVTTTRAVTTALLTTGIPTTGVPTTGVPTTGVPTTGVPTTGLPIVLTTGSTTGLPVVTTGSTTGVPVVTTASSTGEGTTEYTEATTEVVTTGSTGTTAVVTTKARTTRARTTGTTTTGSAASLAAGFLAFVAAFALLL